MNFIKRCWAEISVSNLISNLNLIKNTVGDETEIVCVVKANAYGHGDEFVSLQLQENGVRYFAVASLSEAMHLRQIGVTADIILLGGCLDDCFQYAAEYDVTLALYDLDTARRLSDYALSVGKKVKTHIKLNTGMSRICFECTNDSDIENTKSAIKEILNLKGICVLGAFTHFSVSDEQDGEDFTKLQFKNFNKIRSTFPEIKLWHCSNSGAIVNYNDYKLDMVRAGILLYGFYNGFGAEEGYKPSLELKTVITQIRNIEPGTSVSYGRTFVADKKTRLAVLSIGYADGYPRTTSGRGCVIINGQYAPIVGRVCMDQTVVDVTDVDCNVGDIVTVIGKDGNLEITADDIAKLDDTINYEILCRISPRVPRVYLKDGEIYNITKYV
ncbi:MAG: alanine racemase [Clostridia bacterium]|nr:alanine racemase [Clostridia bacterium]